MSEEQGLDPETAEKVMDGAYRDVKLGPKTYRLHEPSARVARKFRRLCADLEERQKAAVTAGDVRAQIDVQDEILDGIFAFSEELAADKELIEEHATEREMLVALRACRDLVNDPLASAAAQFQSEAEKKKAATKRTAKKNGA